MRSTGSPAAIGLLCLCALAGASRAADTPRFALEIEGGAVGQTRNEVQIPNDARGTRFSLADVAGEGPWPTGRAYLTWNLDRRHGLRALLAPLSIEEGGRIDSPVDFAGASYDPGDPVEASYRFNSWRLGYRYRFRDEQSLRLWVGFTAKLRDAKVELRQGEVSSKDTDLGFVPLLHLSADLRLAPRWHLDLDFEGLAGGPGRAFDVAAELRYDIDRRWSLQAGYRTLEGGADVSEVYSFAWLHYGVVSAVMRLGEEHGH